MIIYLISILYLRYSKIFLPRINIEQEKKIYKNKRHYLIDYDNSQMRNTNRLLFI